MVKKFFKSRKTVISLIVMLIIFVLIIIAIARGQSIDSMMEALKDADSTYIIAAVVCVPVFVFIQGLVIWISMKTLRQKTSLFNCTLHAFTGYFYCCITPFQMGGPTMQVYYMHKERIPIPVSSIVLLIHAFLYKVVLILVGAGVLIFGSSLIFERLWTIMPIYGIGMLFTVAFCTFLALLIFYPNLATKLLEKILQAFEKIHILKPKPERYDSLRKSMSRYSETASFFSDHKLLMALIAVLTIIQRFVLFLGTYFVYRALGLEGTDWITICILQAIIPLCVDLLPIPGGMGISEWLFAIIFAGVFVGDTLMPGLVLSRGIAYYAQLIMCAVVAVFSHFYFMRVGKKNGQNDEQEK